MTHEKTPVYPDMFDEHLAETEARFDAVGQAPLVSIEQEFSLRDPKDEHDPFRIPMTIQNVPGDPYQQMNRRQLHTEVREDARETIANLVPTTDQERERQQEWYDQVDDFDTGDLINYLLYKGLSEATLAQKDPDASNYYAAIAASAANPLEFRFGKGIFQAGYYDNPGTSEVRIAPSTPVEALRRHSVLIAKLTGLAMKYGVDAQIFNTPHINFSLHDLSGAEPHPIFNMKDEQGRLVMQSAVSGISAMYMDGLSARPKREAVYARAHRFWQENPKFDQRDYYSSHTLGVSMDKVTALRVLPERLELRSGLPMSNDEGSLAQRIFLATTGTYLGINEPELLEGYPTPEIVTRALLEPTKQFDKDRDLHILRAFEFAQGKPDESGVLHFNPEKVDHFMTFIGGAKFIKELTGVEYDQVFGDKGFNKIFETITSSEDGTLTCDEENFRKWWAGLDEDTQIMFESYDIDEDAAPFIASRVGTVRYAGMVQSIEYTATLSADTISGVREGILHSPVAEHLLTPEQRQAFADWIAKRGDAI